MRIDEFDKQVCADCFRSTGDAYWSEKVISWFIRNDFIPALWRRIYLRYVSELL